MFLSLMMFSILFVFVYLWGDYMKILILLEVFSLIFIMVIMWAYQMEYFSLNFIFSCLIFLVCESSMGFMLFIFYISMESEVVKKLNLVQF